jgi:pimeloyl-ACP methyl ester carboxylesterase
VLACLLATGAAGVLVASSAGSGSVIDPPRLTRTKPCAGLSGFTCGVLTVPLDHTGRVAGHLDLAVAVADNAAAPRGVLAVLSGGPGQPGVPFVPRMAARLAPVLRDYRLVFYDQRGTGAGALRCPALQAQMGSSDLRPPTVDAVRSCGAAIGPRRQFFGTDDVVADMESLRMALHAERWTLDGISYGTYVAERYALAHPTHVRRLVLDSVVPHDGSLEQGTPSMRRAGTVLRLTCRVAPRCPSDPADDLAAVVRARQVGPSLLDALVTLSIVDPTYRTVFDVPHALHDARLGRTGALDALLASITRGDATPAEALSQGLHASALCGDIRWPWGSSAAPLAGRAAAVRRATARLPTAMAWPFDRATATGNGLIRQCLPWPPTPATPAPAPGARLPDVPVLLLAGDRDLSTLLEWARREAALAPSAELVIVRGAGHSVQSRAVSDVGRRAVYRFLLGR